MSRLIVRAVLFALVSTALVAGSASEAVAQKKGGVLKVGNPSCTTVRSARSPSLPTAPSLTA